MPAPQTIRQPAGLASALPDDSSDITILDAEPVDSEVTNDKGEIIRIEHGDGSVTVSLGGSLGNVNQPKDSSGWFTNLADKLEDTVRSGIVENLLRGIEADLNSRKDWIDARENFIKLMGLKLETPNLSGASDGAPVEGMSRVRHPMLLEAVLRFQANARSELLPTDGPVKIRNDDTEADLQEDQQANALEMDLNHYLTSTAPEYYPDTDRMLLFLGLGGTQFKKVYRCPLRQRPVSETVDADDLIVNDSATDLKNALRVTHRVTLRPSVVKRMQILGVYRDVTLGDPKQIEPDAQKRAENEQAGIQPEDLRPEDRDREIYECYCELDIPGYEHKIRGEATGLEIPYRVTIDVSSREMLSLTRNYYEDTKELPEPRTWFVKYTFVPGFGFYDIGLGHILGNTTNALTAAWRLMLDNGMFANFPGFLVAKNGTRQNTNIFRVPPGGSAPVDTGGMKLSEAIMPLPYQTQHMPALMTLIQDVAQTGMRVGGTSEMQVGEGRADAPVGTTLAMIEQAIKIMDSVHKRLHAAQCEEFRLLVQCFREHPEDFCERNCKSGTKWTAQSFLDALDNCDLTPQADPNTASHSQRIMKVVALMQLMAQNPSLFDPIAVNKTALQAIGWNNPEQFMAPQSAMGQPPPELLEAQAKTQSEAQKGQAAITTANARLLEAQGRARQNGQQPPADPIALMDARTRAEDAHTKRLALHQQAHDTALEDQNRDQDRASKEHLAYLDLARDILANPAQAEQGAKEVKPIEGEIGA